MPMWLRCAKRRPGFEKTQSYLRLLEVT
jgi:hypothetical protein